METERLIVAVLFALFALAGAWFDWSRRTIPNWLNLAFLLTGLVLSAIFGGWAVLGWTFAHFLVALLIGMGLFALKMWGGGDGKFYAATAAWFVLSQAIALFVAVALAGLLLLAIWLAVARARGRKTREAGALPYGIAIAAGGLFLQFTGFAFG